MQRIILASASPRRAELLQQLGLAFEVIPSHIAEDFPDRPSEPGELVQQLALIKAQQVVRQVLDRAEAQAAAKSPDKAWVIGTDTVVVLKGRILEKPRDPAEAAKMLSGLSGREHRVLTGLAVCEAPGNRSQVTCTETRVRFRELTATEIKAYLASGEPYDKAGAYGIQGKGAAFVAGITGCYFNVVGLPLSQLVSTLHDFGGTIR